TRLMHVAAQDGCGTMTLRDILKGLDRAGMGPTWIRSNVGGPVAISLADTSTVWIEFDQEPDCGQVMTWERRLEWRDGGGGALGDLWGAGGGGRGRGQDGHTPARLAGGGAGGVW